MQWTYISFAACLGLSTASYWDNDTLEASISPIHHDLSTLISSHTHTAKLPDFHFDLTRRQNTGRCGSDFNGQSCSSNLCCSHWGYCGDGHDYCVELAGCQPQYGRCGDAPPAPTTSSTSTTVLPTSTSTSTPVTPTSTSSTVSTTSSSTIVSTSTSSTVSSPFPSGTLVASTNGMCGNSTTCAGSGFGSCCSQFWYCGNSPDFCGAGCNPLFGTCSGVVTTSSSSTSVVSTTSSSTSSTVISTTSTTSVSSTSTTSSAPTTTTNPGLPVSTDAACGNGVTCLGSAFGNCCSQFGYCGSGTSYCSPILNCQPQWGTCNSS